MMGEEFVTLTMQVRRLREKWDAKDRDRSNDHRTRDMAFGAVTALDEVLALLTDNPADVQAELARLRQWKAEASEVMLGMQDLGEALGLPLGERITGPKAVEAAQRLRVQADQSTTPAPRLRVPEPDSEGGAS